MNVALFVSGRLLGYDTCLLPFLNRFSKDYNIKVFFSINTLSLGEGEDMNTIISNLKRLLGIRFGDIYYEEYKLPYDYVQTKLQNGIDVFLYNQMSCFYNDKQNLRIIEDYQRKYNITFDVISKIRSDIYPTKNCIYFKQDEPDTLMIHTAYTFIRHWGHVFEHFSYAMVSDAFAYGNMKSMRIYCKTYDWILEQNKLRNGRYVYTFEILLTDSILNHCIGDYDDGHNNPTISENQLFDIFFNNSNSIKISYSIDIEYHLMPTDMRSKNNFIVDKTNVLKYTQPCPE
jgi:hypothetical protein